MAFEFNKTVSVPLVLGLQGFVAQSTQWLLMLVNPNLQKISFSVGTLIKVSDSKIRNQIYQHSKNGDLNFFTGY